MYTYSCIHIHKYKVRIRILLSVKLAHWGRVTHICVGNLSIIGPDNGLSPRRRQAIIWTNAGILLIGLWGTNFSEILIGIHTFSFKKIRLKMSSAKRRPFCIGLNVLTYEMSTMHTQEHPFSIRERMCLWKCRSFWDKKCLGSRGTRTTKLRIHVECSNHLSFRGQHVLFFCFGTLALEA